jgi:branched-chain amino acid transport system substrate-binding protein
MNTTTIQFRPLVLALSVAAACAAQSASAEVVKVAFIDTLTGVFAPVGQGELKGYQLTTEIAKQQKWSEHTLEFVPFDNKGSPQESLNQLKAAIDQGIRYVAQGNGSGVALALVDAINKHNERNPGKEVVLLNHAAVDPDLTNSKCSFWHFRFDANTDMKMEALTNALAKDQSVKKVYIIGQNYAHGHQVTRVAKELIKRKRPDIEIVGDDLHPIAQVKDFSPYVAKIKASGADTVVTGNWGADLTLLVKAAKDAGLNTNFYTYYANLPGTGTAMGASGVDRVKVVFQWTPNSDIATSKDYIEAFQKKYDGDIFLPSTYTIPLMLLKAMKEARSTNAVKVAYAMEGMTIKTLNGEVEMRKRDHQLQQPLYIATWSRQDGKTVKYDQDKTGYGWKTDQKLDSFVAAQPTSCEMKRPARPV